MRTFLISLSLLLVTVSLCLWSFFIVTRDATALYTLAETIPIPSVEEDLSAPIFAESLDKVRSLWEERRTLFSLGISENTLVSIDRALVTTHAYATARDLPSFVAARAELLLAITRLQALERTFL